MTYDEGKAILQDAGLSERGIKLQASDPSAAVRALERIARAEGLGPFAFRGSMLPDCNLIVLKVGAPAEGKGEALPPELKGLNDL